MSTDVIRNPYEIERFAEKVETFVDDMKHVCDKMQGDMDNATGTMRDDTGLAALARLSELVNDIKSALPGASDLQRKLVGTARPGFEYLDVKY